MRLYSHRDQLQIIINMQSKKIKTYGFELVVIGVTLFVLIIALSIAAYTTFIKDRVKKSTEYKTAVYFLVHSPTIKEQLLSPIKAISFKNLSVSERSDYGICEITFSLILNNDLTEELRVGLVKVADYWIVYESVLNPDTPSTQELVSTYQKILIFLDYLSYQDVQTAGVVLDIIKTEIQDANLLAYLQARLKTLAGDDAQAIKTLDALAASAHYAVPAALYERAMIDFDNDDFKNAITQFLQVKNKIEVFQTMEEIVIKQQSIFHNLPKDPFIVIFNHDNIMAELYQNLALAYYHTGDFAQGQIGRAHV